MARHHDYSGSRGGVAHHDDSFGNVITGSRKQDDLRGGFGNDTIFAGDGDDFVSDSAVFMFHVPGVNLVGSLEQGGDDKFFGQDGDDRLRGEDGDDELDGGDDQDRLEGNRGDDELDGGRGDDVLIGGAGADAIVGGSGTDTASFLGRDTIPRTSVWAEQEFVDLGRVLIDLENGAANEGEAAGDTYSSIEHFDLTPFNDIFRGNDQGDTISGNDGHDTIEGRGGADTIVGGDGADTAAYTSSAEGVDVDLGAGQGRRGDAEGDRLSGIENLAGSHLSDVLIGSGAGNIINGAGGNDLLDGAGGDDVLDGGSGLDKLVGGEGDDTFRFDELSDLQASLSERLAARHFTGITRIDGPINVAREHILDFVRGDDTIDLRGLDANTLVAGNQAFQIVGAFSGVAGQLVLETTRGTFNETHAVVRGDLNGDGRSDFTFEVDVVANTGFLDRTDFLL